MYTSKQYKYDARRLTDEIASLETEHDLSDAHMRMVIREIITSLINELAECDERWQSDGVDSKPPVFELTETMK